MFGRMDRYLARAVVEAYVATGATFVLIVILFDLLANAGQYLRMADQALDISVVSLMGLLAQYYACWLPGMFLSFAPYVTVIASMFAVSKLTSANEIVPMVFSGRSMFRVLRPVLLIAIGSALTMAAVWEWVAPMVSGRFLVLKAMLEDGRVDDAAKGVLVHAASGQQVLFCEKYRNRLQQMEEMTVYDRGAEGEGPSVYRARFADWEADGEGRWVLSDGVRHHGNRIMPCPALALPGITPDTVWHLSRGANAEQVQLLSYSELARLRELRPGRHDLRLQYHVHFTMPLACIILILLTLPLAVYFERGSRAERVVFAILICAAYLVFDLASRSLGLRQFVDPAVAAWGPVIVFGAFGAVFYSSVRT